MDSPSPSSRMGNSCCFEFLPARNRQGTKQVSQDCKRTTNSVFRLRCAERPEIGRQSLSHPVKLIVFDFDETLTLVTLMTPDGTYLPEQREWAKEVNFETPWVPGSRVAKLEKMFQGLAQGKDGELRVLAILTRNGNSSGVAAVINLLKAAALDRHFSAVWTLPHRHGRRNGAYQEGGKWFFFDPPVRRTHDHKADVLRQITDNPKAWFPQIATNGASEISRRLSEVLFEEVVLVDDQRSNFQSETGARVLRYCKVARYDAEYRDFGLMRDMGGIGAHDDADYETLKRFVEDPWMCKDTFQVRCQERDFEGCADMLPVKLVVFDFDETLTLATFMPDDPEFENRIGWSCSDSQWSREDLVEYNFESPYVQGSRVAKLQEMLTALAGPKDGSSRALAILTKNEHGVIAVLNLLTLAGLAGFFNAIWTIPARSAIPNGAYRDEDGSWKSFDPPVGEVHEHKADVLHHVAENPAAWFPQLTNGGAGALHASLDRLRIEGIVLVDDERANFRSNSEETQAKVLRYCKVARYDEDYRDCGPLNQMGGIGAHSDVDYETLKSFVEEPWQYPYENNKEEHVKPLAAKATTARLSMASEGSARDLKSLDASATQTGDDSESAFRRDNSSAGETEPPKAPRVRKSPVVDKATAATADAAAADAAPAAGDVGRAGVL